MQKKKVDEQGLTEEGPGSMVGSLDFEGITGSFNGGEQRAGEVGRPEKI